MRVRIFNRGVSGSDGRKFLEDEVNNFLDTQPKSTVEWKQSAVFNSESKNVRVYLTAIITYP